MSLYRDSLRHIDEAERAARKGDTAASSAAYREAARLQRRFVESLSADRPKTRTAFSLSVATLLHRAGDHDEARRYATAALAAEELDDRLREALHAFL